MLKQDNLLALLAALQFEKKRGIYRKVFGEAVLDVNIEKKEITYPETSGLVIHERQTCNFEANENFVVLECVCRLMEKGYKPEHIELEPKWKLGHGASGGRADILVKDNFDKPLLIIECKTGGSEFQKAWNKTLQDGDQLFSYAQQVSETKFLCLYTSDLDSGSVIYTSHIIAHRDNEKYLADNPLFKSFSSVTDVRERYAVWRDTYKLDYTTKGIFEQNIQPYHIGKDKYSLADLHTISDADRKKKYDEFATILRQHNVSGRENAFDKLINLFLCKLVDEIENPDDLKFYWKGVAYDTHFDLIDRMQRLYQSGMGQFLGEDITYINQYDVNNAMRFIRQNPDATQRAVWKLFVQQKFFTNNDFSFIDVHNEKLFYQNAEVLLKILQMWQDTRLTDPDGHNQFLGDMFEGFLDQGVKQSEGQFFTPKPICTFIIMSLPLESLIRDNPTPPMCIDYACGAGHFLTELALRIQPLQKQHKPLADSVDYHKSIIGIEKEYRLSKVAKVSAFMNSLQDIQICYGDGLINSHDVFPDIRDNNFDLLVANPPYSVRGFIETIPERDRSTFTLNDTINDIERANSIETFFIERAKQLLKGGGVASIILPSPILSNGGSTRIRTREILLQYFDIVAIVELSNGTFGKTGTNTVTLFLRRKATAPDTAAHYRDRVDEWFKGCNADKRKQVIYKDEHLIARYAKHIGIPLNDYKTLLKGDLDGAWITHLEGIYLGKFNESAEVDNLYKAKWFKALTTVEQDAELDNRFLAFVQMVERDKLYHFVMASDQSNPVLIIRSPRDAKENQQFLGYNWSDLKGDEGIKLFKDNNNQHLTALYDENNLKNSEKISYYIAANFEGVLGNTNIPAVIQKFARTSALVDMLDFSHPVFEKKISLSEKKSIFLVTRWPTSKLGEVVTVLIGGTPSRKNRLYFTGSNLWVSISEMSGNIINDTKEKITDEAVINSNVKLIPKGTTLLSFKLSIGKVAIAGEDLYTNEAIAGLIPKQPKKILDGYLYHIFSARYIDLAAMKDFNAFGKSLNSAMLRDDVIIPIPSISVQEDIIRMCDIIDTSGSDILAEGFSIDDVRAEIERRKLDVLKEHL